MMHLWLMNHWKYLMTPSNLRPKWWQLYLNLPLLLALFAMDSRLKISTRGHQAVQIGIVILVYGLIHLWLKANMSALTNLDRRQERGRIIVIRVPALELSEMDREKGPMFELPASELKSLLSNTFDVDYIDAEVLDQEYSDGRVDGVLPSYRDHKLM